MTRKRRDESKYYSDIERMGTNNHGDNHERKHNNGKKKETIKK